VDPSACTGRLSGSPTILMGVPYNFYRLQNNQLTDRYTSDGTYFLAAYCEKGGVTEPGGRAGIAGTIWTGITHGQDRSLAPSRGIICLGVAKMI
jgi:hypothetical protein